MSLQFSTAVRNAMLDSIESTVGTAAVLKIRTGDPPSDCATADSGSVLASITLASDWAAAASGGAKAWSGLPVSDSSIDLTGTAGHWRLYASDGTTCHAQGTVTVTDGGGDLEVDSVSFVSAQSFSITAWTWTAPGA
jgi:hypothetical protein